MTVCSAIAVLPLFATVETAPAQVVTEIIDATGDGSGNTLSRGQGVAVDGSGNVYVTGNTSNNAFKITPAGEPSHKLSDDSSNLK